MKLTKKIIIFALMMVLPILHQATESIIEEYLTIAAKNNPSLKAMYCLYQATLEEIPQAAALPDPQISLGFYPMPMERYSGDQLLDISLMQMFPWFGTLYYAKQEAVLMAQAKREEYNNARSMIFFEVKATWYALYLLEKEISSTQDHLKLFKTLEQLSFARLQSGASTGTAFSAKTGNTANDTTSNAVMGMAMTGMGDQNKSSVTEPAKMNRPAMNEMEPMASGNNLTDTFRLQMEINELRYRLAQLEDRKKPLTARFNQLLNRPSDSAVSVPDTLISAQLPDNIRKIKEDICSHNPMIKMLEQEEKALLAEKNMKQKMSWPMLGLGLQYSIFKARPHNESMLNGKNMLMPMVSVSIPLWRKKYRASVREADYKKQSVIEQKQEFLNSLLVEVEQTLIDFNDANQRLNLYKQQSALTEQSLNLLMTAYTASGSKFEDLLRWQQQLLDFRFKMETAVTDTLIAAAKLKRLMGE